LEEARIRQIIGGIAVKKNRGFTLVELILVMACIGLVLVFFWSILQSTSEDTYTINDKIAVQTSVTSLMNIIQKDIQEAKIVTIEENGTEKGIVLIDGAKYIFNTYNAAPLVYNDKTVVYEFDVGNRTVTRTEGSGNNAVSVYSDIADFSMTKVEGSSKYGIKVDIQGGKEPKDAEVDKSRYSLSSTYYARNTL